VCTGVWESRPPEPSSLRSCTGRRRIRFLGSALCATAPKFFTTVRLLNAASTRRLHRRKARGIINMNVPPPLINNINFIPSSAPSTSSSPSTTSIVVRFYSRDLILSFIMFHLCYAYNHNHVYAYTMHYANLSC
jgi:hypothetical protein